MALPRITSPHATGHNRTRKVMQLVLLATLPGVLVLTWLYGFGTLINLCWAGLVAVGCEAAVLRLRERPVRRILADRSALLTGVLLALALPPYAPWWLTLVASAFAIAKVPTVSILAAIMGTPDQATPACLNVNSRSSSTSERLFKVERLGRIRTSLKPSFRSSSMRMCGFLVMVADA